MPEDITERRLWLAIDVVGYGKRPDEQKHAVQEALREIVDAATENAGLRSGKWDTQPSGDGQKSAIPADEPERKVVDEFVRHLVALLRRHNAPFSRENRLRLRVAIHHGPYVLGANGWDGRVPVELTRLVDSEPLRNALRRKCRADVAVALSDPVYKDIVASDSTTLNARHFSHIKVEGKKNEPPQQAWLWVPDGRFRNWPRSLVTTLVVTVIVIATAAALYLTHAFGLGDEALPTAQVTIEPGGPYHDGSKATAYLTTTRAVPRPSTRRVLLTVSNGYHDQVLCLHSTTVSLTLDKDSAQISLGSLHSGDTFGVPLEAGQTDATLDLAITMNSGCGTGLSFDDITAE